MTQDEEIQLKKQVQDIHDALIGNFDKPGLMRLSEKMWQDMYDERDGVLVNIKTYKNDRRWVLGVVTGIGLGAGAVGAWIRSLFGK